MSSNKDHLMLMVLIGFLTMVIISGMVWYFVIHEHDCPETDSEKVAKQQGTQELKPKSSPPTENKSA